ncbi:MAG TPA: hypothetical protein VK361_05295 [Rubrobacteraceae bacterium]|nr:hypothetical protein [Rubrobacteraceae bacterium]
MSAHWRLALSYAIWVSAGAAVVGVLVWFLYGEAHAGAFVYGAGAGIVSFVSTALTVSLLTGRSKAFGMMIGGGSFMVRYGFAVVALGVPAYLSLWPVVPMLVGFAGSYLAENVVLLPRVMMAKVTPGGSVVRETGERRVEA